MHLGGEISDRICMHTGLGVAVPVCGPGRACPCVNTMERVSEPPHEPTLVRVRQPSVESVGESAHDGGGFIIAPPGRARGAMRRASREIEEKVQSVAPLIVLVATLIVPIALIINGFAELDPPELMDLNSTRRYLLIKQGKPGGLPLEHGEFNVQGPSVIRAPAWLPDPPGKYLMYFGHHKGKSIRLAAADKPSGPWKIVSTDVLNYKDAGVDVDGDDAHVASPDAHVHEPTRSIRLYFHGHASYAQAAHLPWWYDNGGGTWLGDDRKPTTPWGSRAQFSFVAVSIDGRRFIPAGDGKAIGPSYLRMFHWDGWW